LDQEAKNGISVNQASELRKVGSEIDRRLTAHRIRRGGWSPGGDVDSPLLDYFPFRGVDMIDRVLTLSAAESRPSLLEVRKWEICILTLPLRMRQEA
jgi:hypothetical protein